MLICFHQRVQKWMLLALFAITSSLLSYLAVDGDGDFGDDDNHDDHHHHNSSIILTWQVMVLGCLKLIPSIFGPGKERQRGATGENGGFVFLSFPFHFAIPIPSSGYLCAFSLYQKYSFTIDVHVFLKYCAKSDYSRANSIWECQSVSRGLFYNLISHSYTKCFFYKGFFRFTLARERRLQDKVTPIWWWWNGFNLFAFLFVRRRIVALCPVKVNVNVNDLLKMSQVKSFANSILMPFCQTGNSVLQSCMIPQNRQIYITFESANFLKIPSMLLSISNLKHLLLKGLLRSIV